MPRKKVDHSEERRMSLGDYERKLESDKLAMRGVEAAATAIAGIAQGLGLGGGLVLAAFLWGKDIEKLFQQLVGIWPESGTLFSPEWIAKWGDDPLDILSQDLGGLDNDEVDVLISNNGSLVGRSPYDVYTIASSGRAAAWTHNKSVNQNITHTEYLELNGWKSYNYPAGEGANSGWLERHMARWTSQNPQPPSMLTFEQCAIQNAIRITCARRDTTQFFGILNYLQQRNPTKMENYTSDVLLDWLVYTESRTTTLEINMLDLASPNPYDYKTRKKRGIQIIESYAFWSATP